MVTALPTSGFKLPIPTHKWLSNGTILVVFVIYKENALGQGDLLALVVFDNKLLD